MKMRLKKCFYSVREVMGCQIVRTGEGKMRSPGEGREKTLIFFTCFTVGVVGHRLYR